MLLVRQLLAQFSFPVLAGAIIGRAFGIGGLLRRRRLFGVRGLLGLGSLSRCGVGIGRLFRLRREVGLRRAARLRGPLCLRFLRLGLLRLGFLSVCGALLLFRRLGILRRLGVFCRLGILRRLGLFRSFGGGGRLRLFGS